MNPDEVAGPKTYRVTLTHKEKTEVEAESPQEALQKAKEAFGGLIFEPATFAVKEV